MKSQFSRVPCDDTLSREQRRKVKNRIGWFSPNWEPTGLCLWRRRSARQRAKCRMDAITVAIFTLIVNPVGSCALHGAHIRHVSGVQYRAKVRSARTGQTTPFPPTPPFPSPANFHRFIARFKYSSRIFADNSPAFRQLLFENLLPLTLGPANYLKRRNSWAFYFCIYPAYAAAFRN